MQSSVRNLRVNTVELLRHAGQRRDVDVDVLPAELGITDQRLAADEVIAVRLAVVSTVDGLVVTGSVDVTVHEECRRCLRAVVELTSNAIDELYQEQVSDPDAFEIGPDALDLTPLVRDAAMLSLAGPPPLCRDDCQGICPQCGADRNETSCACDTTVIDARWAALEGFDPDA
ncbi:MAG TPA: DUF177 domain-containing protein [Ilumatobacteraceae bacterium]